MSKVFNSSNCFFSSAWVSPVWLPVTYYTQCRLDTNTHAWAHGHAHKEMQLWQSKWTNAVCSRIPNAECIRAPIAGPSKVRLRLTNDRCRATQSHLDTQPNHPLWTIWKCSREILC